MRILGIDPGSAATGWGVVDAVKGEVHHVAHGTFRPPRTAALSSKLAFLHAGLAEVILLHGPETAVVERVFVANNARSALVLGQARGALLAALGAGGLAVEELAAREVKQAVVGTGAAAKPQVQAMLTRLLSLDPAPPSDAADALAAAICAAHQNRYSALGGVGGRRSRSRRRANWTARRGS